MALSKKNTVLLFAVTTGLVLFFANMYMTRITGSWESDGFMYSGRAVSRTSEMNPQEQWAHREEVFSRRFEFHRGGTGIITSLERGEYHFTWVRQRYPLAWNSQRTPGANLAYRFTLSGDRGYLTINGADGAEIFEYRVRRSLFVENAAWGPMLWLTRRDEGEFSSRSYSFFRPEVLVGLERRGIGPLDYIRSNSPLAGKWAGESIQWKSPEDSAVTWLFRLPQSIEFYESGNAVLTEAGGETQWFRWTVRDGLLVLDRNPITGNLEHNIYYSAYDQELTLTIVTDDGISIQAFGRVD